MFQPTSATSIASSLQVSSKTKSVSYEKILKVLEKQTCSRSALSQLTGLRVSSVCGRVFELIEMGKIEVVGKIYDNVTQRNVETLAIVPARDL